MEGKSRLKKEVAAVCVDAKRAFCDETVVGHLDFVTTPVRSSEQRRDELVYGDALKASIRQPRCRVLVVKCLAGLESLAAVDVAKNPAVQSASF